MGVGISDALSEIRTPFRGSRSTLSTETPPITYRKRLAEVGMSDAPAVARPLAKKREAFDDHDP